MNKLCMFILWIWIQGADLQQQKNATIILDKDSVYSDPFLICSHNEAIVIDEIFCYNSVSNSCSSVTTTTCKVTLKTQYVIHEKCSVKKGNCSVGNISSLYPVSENTSVKPNCLMVRYSCVPDSNMLDICSNFDSSAEVSNNSFFLTLHQSNTSYNGCYCNITSSEFSLTVKDLRLYDDNRKCSPTVVLIWIPKDPDLELVCNKANVTWPHFSSFLEQPTTSTSANIYLDYIVGQKAPSVLIEIKASHVVNVSCKTQGVQGPLSTTQSETTSSSDNTAAPLSFSLANQTTVTETSLEPMSMTSVTTSEHVMESTRLTLVMPVLAGIVVVVGVVFLVTCYIYKRKRNPKPEIGFALNPPGEENLYYMINTNETPEQTQTDNTNNPSGQCGKDSRVATKFHQAHVNANGIAPSAQANVEKHTIPTTKAIPHDAMPSSYDHIKLQSIQTAFKETKLEIYSYDHLTNQATHLDEDSDNYDVTFNHLHDGYLNSSGSHEMDTYEHFDDRMNTFARKGAEKIGVVAETYNRLDG